jgi:hypothetical protein
MKTVANLSCFNKCMMAHNNFTIASFTSYHPVSSTGNHGKNKEDKAMWKRSSLFVCCVLVLAFLFLTGCEKSELTEPENNFPENSEVSNEDVALSVAGMVCENSGGVLDQVGDVSILATLEGPDMLSKSIEVQGICEHTATYDSVNQIWTIEIFRERGTPADSIYAKFERTYTLQIMNQYGQPQQFWITEGDTAHSFDFDILGGTGIHIRPHFYHELQSISGGWLGTGMNTDMITINGTYQRAAIDTLSGERGTRISDHNVALALYDVTGPRGSRRNLSQKVSGTITGLFTATVTIIKENVTIIKEIEREINIILGIDEMTIWIGKEQFKADPLTGRLK